MRTSADDDVLLGLGRHVDASVDASDSEKNIASVFRAEVAMLDPFP
jgi:hypothetical protein